MLNYSLVDRIYIGDGQMRLCTRKKNHDRATPTQTREIGSVRPSTSYAKLQRPEAKFFKEEKGIGGNYLLFESISRSWKHIKSVTHSLKYPKTFNMCGGSAYLVCGTYGVALHFLPQKRDHKRKQ